MLIYLNLKNLFPKRVWCGGVSPHRCAWVVANGYGTCCCHLLSMVVDFMLLCDIYIAFYFELADDTYSVLVPCTDPYLYLFFFVNCGVQQTYRRLQLNRNSSQSSLHRISG